MSAKEVWDILHKVYEGMNSVKRKKLDTLASQFENLKMSDDDTIVGFGAKISSIANEAQVLGKKYKDVKLVKNC